MFESKTAPLFADDLAGLARRIVSLREAAGLTHQAFGEAIGFKKRTIIKWEQRESEPSASVLISIVQAFGADPKWLLTGPGDEPQYLTESAGAKTLRLQRQVAAMAIREGIELMPEGVTELAAELEKVDDSDMKRQLMALRKALRKNARGWGRCAGS